MISIIKYNREAFQLYRYFILQRYMSPYKDWLNWFAVSVSATVSAAILGFHQSCDQNKNRNHSIKKVRSLRYDRWLIYNQPCQESGLCFFPFLCYLYKCVTQIYRALSGDAMFVSFWGIQTCSRKVTETSFTAFC